LKKALIIGANGQDGHYLGKILETRKYKVFKTYRTKKIGLKLDILNFKELKDFIARKKPDLIFNFAARSDTSHKAAQENARTIVIGTVNLLEACFQLRSRAKIFIAGSGLQFENRNKPIRKQDPLSCRSAYACARNATLFYSRYYRNLGLKIYYGFLFNHESPLRNINHLTQRLWRDAIRLMRGEVKVIKIIDDSVVKEWSHAQSTCEQIYKFTASRKPGEEIIGSGAGYSINQFVLKILSIYKHRHKGRLFKRTGQKAEFKKMVSAPGKFRTHTGLARLVLDLKSYKKIFKAPERLFSRKAA
jgi:GDPmannose 4,6-dehydratase